MRRERAVGVDQTPGVEHEEEATDQGAPGFPLFRPLWGQEEFLELSLLPGYFCVVLDVEESFA